jgi:hypothetical protein
MVYLIYHEDEKYLDPRDAASLLVKAMPTILIDWVRGNQIVEEQRQKLVARHFLTSFSQAINRWLTILHISKFTFQSIHPIMCFLSYNHTNRLCLIVAIKQMMLY